jgi:3-phenylpropionate/trans-cinnamate dioxygenase ferredoxin reductase subunit
MIEKSYYYVIVGGGLAGVSAVEGIREVDKEKSILLIGSDSNLPYDRPPLSKKLWFGKKKLGEIFLHDKAFYSSNKVELALGTTVLELSPIAKMITTDKDQAIYYSRLLLATGGTPRRLEIPGGSLTEICYYRTIDDYKTIRRLAGEGKKAVIIGGGFIGSELAAALSVNKVEVTIIFPEDYLVQRIFPAELGKAIQRQYQARGIKVLNRDLPLSLEKRSGLIITRTKNGEQMPADMVIVGAGITPAVSLAEKAGLECKNGVLANEYLQTSDKDIYTAGDNTSFLSLALGERMRVEHWDNSIAQGKTAGRNMAGAGSKFDYIPYFFSDLFEFGYEAAGILDSRFKTTGYWKKEYETGIVYYLKDDVVKGVMLCNVWDKIAAARELIKKQAKIPPAELKNAIEF